MASRDTTSRDSSVKLDSSNVCKSIVKTYRKKSEPKILDTSCEDKENLYDLKQSLQMVKKSLEGKMGHLPRINTSRRM